jgi:hypothetical protein
LKLFEKYVKVYNKKKAPEVSAAKFEIKPQNNSIILGIQGGHQLTAFKQNYLSSVDPVFEKII